MLAGARDLGERVERDGFVGDEGGVECLVDERVHQVLRDMAPAEVENAHAELAVPDDLGELLGDIGPLAIGLAKGYISYDFD